MTDHHDTNTGHRSHRVRQNFRMALDDECAWCTHMARVHFGDYNNRTRITAIIVTLYNHQLRTNHHIYRTIFRNGELTVADILCWQIERLSHLATLWAVEIVQIPEPRDVISAPSESIESISILGIEI